MGAVVLAVQREDADQYLHFSRHDWHSVTFDVAPSTAIIGIAPAVGDILWNLVNAGILHKDLRASWQYVGNRHSEAERLFEHLNSNQWNIDLINAFRVAVANANSGTLRYLLRGTPKEVSGSTSAMPSQRSLGGSSDGCIGGSRAR
jgi:hypothetical protein